MKESTNDYESIDEDTLMSNLKNHIKKIENNDEIFDKFNKKFILLQNE